MGDFHEQAMINTDALIGRLDGVMSRYVGRLPISEWRILEQCRKRLQEQQAQISTQKLMLEATKEPSQERQIATKPPAPVHPKAQGQRDGFQAVSRACSGCGAKVAAEVERGSSVQVRCPGCGTGVWLKAEFTGAYSGTGPSGYLISYGGTR